MRRAVLDAGALIAIERGDRRMQAPLDEARVAGTTLTILRALAQVGGARPDKLGWPGSFVWPTSR
jgi:hypothetical protein